jgi:hypothetical protein
MTRNESGSAHNKAVNALSDARQHVRQYVFELERANVRDNQVFVASSSPKHPQKSAHAALMDYYQEINQVEYILMFDDLWNENLTDAAGNELSVAVPKSAKVTKSVDERTGVDNMTPNMAEIDTKQEPVSLETLGYKWAGRTVTVEATVDSPYRDTDKRVEAVRMWLPPVFIKEAYSQLNDCLSQVGLLANTSAPIEKDPDPI